MEVKRVAVQRLQALLPNWGRQTTVWMGVSNPMFGVEERIGVR